MKEYKLSTQPYKGTQDFYPKDMVIRNYLFDIWRETALEFGYEEYDTPIVEDANIYRAKSGDEIVDKQLYNFIDKGDREIAIRPEMTPSLARIVAARLNGLSKPIRWFNIGKFYRYEKPQRGRTREFFQLNIDIFGIEGLEAELELFQFIIRVMEKLKAPKETYCIYYNNRYWLDYLFDEMLKLDKDKKGTVGRAIDNYPKMSEEDFKLTLKDLELSEEQIETVLNYLKYEIDDLKQYTKKSKGAKELVTLSEKLDKLGIDRAKFNPAIMRGLDYYTGTVIELFDVGSQKNPRALFGGGRYDDLLEIFDQEKLPAFGLGWGNVSTTDFMETYDLVPDVKSYTDVFVALMGEAQFDYAISICQRLRKEGVRVEQQLEPSSLSKQFRYADRKGIPWVIIAGPEEIAKKVVKLKNMKSGNQQEVEIDKAAEIIHSKAGS
jgi:histidyl-tRNA synthetase